MTKYKNTKIQYDGITFDSKKEKDRYIELKLLERAGEIKDLELQKVFVLVPAVKLNGRTKPAVKYLSDFSYVQVKDGQTIVEDVKSPVTRKLAVYRLKIHLLKHVQGIEITEI